jgi:general secretion pathway protein G
MGEGPGLKALFVRRLRRGYTLTEMLVVLVIIGLISAIIIPQTLGQMDRAKARAAKMKLESIASALEMYSTDLARYPTASQGLAALFEAPAGVADWMGPYVSDRTLLTDPWGEAVVYEAPSAEGEKYALLSLGSDRKPGGDGFKRDVRLQPAQ